MNGLIFVSMKICFTVYYFPVIMHRSDGFTYFLDYGFHMELWFKDLILNVWICFDCDGFLGKVG